MLNRTAIEPVTYNFGEVASLQEVFAEVKKRRKGRQPPYVMIVEDDLLTHRIVSNSLKENYALITAHDAQEAVANYILHAPDVVFLDIGLPMISGFKVLRQIIACDPDAYVVMFSSQNYPETIAKALDEGAMGFVVKPFKKKDLYSYIQSSAMHHCKSGA